MSGDDEQRVVDADTDHHQDRPAAARSLATDMAWVRSAIRPMPEAKAATALTNGRTCAPKVRKTRARMIAAARKPSSLRRDAPAVAGLDAGEERHR